MSFDRQCMSLKPQHIRPGAADPKGERVAPLRELERSAGRIHERHESPKRWNVISNLMRHYSLEAGQVTTPTGRLLARVPPAAGANDEEAGQEIRQSRGARRGQ